MRMGMDLSRCGTMAAVLAAAFGVACAEAAEDPHSSDLAPGVSLYGDPKAPDISGLWLGTVMAVPGQRFQPGRGPADERGPTYWAPSPLPYTAAYQKIYDDQTAAAKVGRQPDDIGVKCLPFGMPQAFVSNHYQDEIVQTPGAVTILAFGTFPVVIWTDGRGHPENLESSYNGHSIGYWQDGKLHVDTVGINGSTPIDANHNRHSAKLHMATTIERGAKDVVEFHITLYDEEAFSEPPSATSIFHRKSGARWQVLDDASCFGKDAETYNSKPGFPKID